MTDPKPPKRPPHARSIWIARPSLPAATITAFALLGTLGTLGAVGLLSGCDQEADASKSKSKSGRRGRGVEIDRAVVVETAPAERQTLERIGNYVGSLRAADIADLSAEIAGPLRSVKVRLGDRVEEGQLLAQIDTRTLRQQLRELAAALKIAQAQHAEARVNAENLSQEIARRKPLAADGLVTAREVEDLETRLAAARQRIALSDATVEQARARLTNVREDLRRASIKAPFDGQVAQRQAEPGQVVQPGARLFRVVSSRGLYLRVDVPEHDAGFLRPGMRGALRIDALGRKACPGEVLRVAPMLDDTSRSLPVDVALDPSCFASSSDKADDAASSKNDGESDGTSPADVASNNLTERGLLNARPRVGMFAELRLPLARRERALQISNQAILKAADGSRFAWRIRDGKAERAALTLGLRGRSHSQILDGLQEGDLVVIRGQEKLKDGAPAKSSEAGAGEEAADKRGGKQPGGSP